MKTKLFKALYAVTKRAHYAVERADYWVWKQFNPSSPGYKEIRVTDASIEYETRMLLHRWTRKLNIGLK